MTARTHDLAAFTALSVIALSFPLPQMTIGTLLVAVMVNQLGGIAPDIDQPTAPFWRNLPIGGIFGRIFDRLLGGHRFLSHSIIGLIIFSVAVHYLLVVLHPSFPSLDINIIWWAFIIGYVSHLVMDTITKEGVPWLLPIPIKFGIPPLSAFRVQTGGFVETFIVFPLLLLGNVGFFYVNYHILLRLVHHYIR